MNGLLISTEVSFFLVIFCLIVGAFGALFFRRSDAMANLWGNSFAIFGAISGLILASQVFSSEALVFSLSSALPLLSFDFYIDKLSAFFIFIISLLSLFTSVYALSYVKHFYGKYNLGVLGFFYNLFILGMFLVASAGNAFFFLIVWEIMSLASYFLVIFENKEKENIRAGLIYFIMTHVGTAFIFLAFLLLYKFSGTFNFSMMRENLENVPVIIKHIIFFLMLVGFGTKAGIIPLHIWLPRAHPVAPTHVSALMSGVMIKTGVYMFIRIFMDILPNIPAWYGEVVLIIGAISSLGGVLYALTEHDIKKLLAYHSIENIGIILLGLGSSMIFISLDMAGLAILGLVAALFHTLNHAIFKAVLFLGAGSVISQAHTRNMEKYGGLIRYMPQTAFFFLVGSMAISALPPFNGFFSEWATFQALFSGVRYLDRLTQGILIFGAASLAMTGGLAVACFVKVFGVTFLARPRSEEVKKAKEAKLTMRIGMGGLALLTLVIGIFSGAVMEKITLIATERNLLSGTKQAFFASKNFVGLSDGFAFVSAPIIFMAIVLVLLGVFVVSSIITRKRKIVLERTWDCGTELGPRMEITATGFARSIILIFKGVLKPTKQNTIEYCDANMRYFAKKNLVKLDVVDFWTIYFYQPAQKSIAFVSDYFKKIQSGNVNAYILYIFLTLIGLLVFLVV